MLDQVVLATVSFFTNGTRESTVGFRLATGELIVAPQGLEVCEALAAVNTLDLHPALCKHPTVIQNIQL